MDIAETTAPRSDQQNYDDYAGGSKIVTVTEVKAGSAEQPVEIHLAEYPGRPFKPSKSMRRVLVACWGSDSAAYVGRTMKLYGDPTVKFGGQTVGGIRIGALSHLDKPVTVALTVTRGKRAPFTVQPLPTPQTAPQRDWMAELKVAADIDKGAVASLGTAARAANAGEQVIAAITKTWQELNAAEGEAGQ